MKKQVLQKYIASSGHCSRRRAEEIIREGRVYVNNETAELGARVDDDDKVKIGSKIIRPNLEFVYIMMNKPVGYTCTNRRFAEEKNVFELLSEEFRTGSGLHSVGRLDKDSSGLVLLTNDGALTQKITHPSFEHEKKYAVLLQGNKERDVKKIVSMFEAGIGIGEDGIVKAKKVDYIGDDEFEIILTEGKKRQIRRMFGEVEERVIFLKRISIGGLELGELKEGEFRKLEIEEIEKLGN
jgi:23S rRNA pseudouridine2605 synthase